MARPQCFETADAINPAASARKIAQNSNANALATSSQVTPPKSIATARKGTTSSTQVEARMKWTKLLPSTMARALNGVKNIRPSVSSRFSRARQSAVKVGTKIQMKKKTNDS